nr:hypothetical protein [Tanacetum cinerariifolium]
STPVISSNVAELKDMVKALLLDKKNQYPAPTPSTTPAPVKAVESNCVNQAPIYQAPIPQTQRVSQIDLKSYVKANNAILRDMQSQSQSTQNQYQNIQNQYQNLQNQMATLTEIMSKLVSANTASSSGSGTLPGNTVTNLKEELKGITTRSGVAYQGPKALSPSKQGTKVTKDQVQAPSSQNTAPVQPLVIQSESQALVFEHVVASVSAPMPNLKPSIPYPSSFTDAFILMPKFASTLKALIENKEKLSEMARTTMNEHYLGASINLMPLSVWEGLSLSELTPTCMTLELADRSVSKPIGITKDVSFKVGVFHFPADFVVVDFEPDPRGDILLLKAILDSEPSLPPPNQEQNLPSFKEELKAYKAQTVKSSVDEPPEVELKDLPHYLEYAFLEGDKSCPSLLLKNLEGITPEFCTHKILMEEDYKPAVQHQRRVNPKIHDVIKKEVKKLLDA